MQRRGCIVAALQHVFSLNYFTAKTAKKHFVIKVLLLWILQLKQLSADSLSLCVCFCCFCLGAIISYSKYLITHKKLRRQTKMDLNRFDLSLEQKCDIRVCYRNATWVTWRTDDPRHHYFWSSLPKNVRISWELLRKKSINPERNI